MIDFLSASGWPIAMQADNLDAGEMSTHRPKWLKVYLKILVGLSFRICTNHYFKIPLPQPKRGVGAIEHTASPEPT